MLLIGRERGKGQIGKIPGPSPSKSGKSQKIGKVPKRTKKDKKGRTSPDWETPRLKPPRLAALEPLVHMNFRGNSYGPMAPPPFFRGNSHGPMALKVCLKFPLRLVLVRGWLFPALSAGSRQTYRNLQPPLRVGPLPLRLLNRFSNLNAAITGLIN